MPPRVFVNYRRDDARDMAARIRDRLSQVFGDDSVFMDVDNLLPGQRFDKQLEDALKQTSVFLAVIGGRWTELFAERRAAGGRDYVREEIAKALERRIIVVPVLIDQTPLPSAAALPHDVRDLVLHQKHVVTYERFGRDVADLVSALGFEHATPKRSAPPPSSEMAITPAAAQLRCFRDVESGPEMVAVPPGSFSMGSNYHGSEMPTHTVTIKTPFAVSRFPLTFSQWDASRLPHKPSDQGWGRGNRPVINISWEDARTYTLWLSEVSGKSYRLLSEAEWEYSCRAGTTTTFSFGDTITRRQAQFGVKETADVGIFQPNGWGLHDMHGNVWEWCEDSWHPDYNGAPGDGSVWRGGDTSLRVVRGGSWGVYPDHTRSAIRSRHAPDLRAAFIGFRVARTL